MNNLKIPNSLLQNIQNDYIASKYKDGVFTLQNIDTDTIEIVIQSLLSWAEEKNHIKNNSLDVSFILRKDL